ncbi:response regulator transcription factor [Bacillus sp. ISL-51]|uniref:response regulator transcription factor n=1 Tax=Bacteria TaxID=2 RepID=UPI001BE58F76|nr:MULTISPECIES: response regulator transcription factor [Bacteria]MBT2573732.1 response regulator transcription factor [Bacillus sp. ISL-51]MBT2634937.1 response regulator transcription factor [Bacillus sp. ISL-26]MBT2712411.1 response regulator transcription factor [Pseudomonas sp. ISL-88]
MIKILLIDDHIGVAQGTKAILEKSDRMEVTILSHSKEVLNHLKHYEYDLILLDLYMPELNGMELSKMILRESPDQKIIIYTGFDIPAHFNLLVEVGISGFISKSSTEEQMIKVIECVIEGDTIIPTHLFKQLRRTEANMFNIDKLEDRIRDITLNEREQDILAGVAEGMTNRELSAKLLISQRAVEYILTGVYNKLGVKSRTEALIKANRYSLISLKTIYE